MSAEPAVSPAHPADPSFMCAPLIETDPEVAHAIREELVRQQDGIELIASENIVSQAVMTAQGSVMTNKYAEGYPGRRYYAGCEAVDVVERLAIERAKQMFGAEYANVQAHSGAQANQAVMLALISPGDTVLGMSLAAGGHLTHGAAPNLSGKWFNAVQYGVDEQTHLINYDEVEALALEHKPKMIVCGASAYPRHIDFKRFREIADKVGAYLLADISHYSGLVVTGHYPSPIPHAHFTTTTTHKILRGPRGGLILGMDPELGKKVNSAIFPGLQGGPLMHVIAAKAVAFKEALSPDFKVYGQRVLDNARALADALVKGGLNLVSGGTDCHLALVDLRPLGVTGRDAEQALERAGITCNKNAIPFDPQKPMITSGIRVGSPAATSRGFGVDAFTRTGEMMIEVLKAVGEAGGPAPEVEAKVREDVRTLCRAYPIYSGI